ncbi:MAG: TonB-dependent receptor [Gallionella sp.]|nr:TonB-dependent receptor [Gallionella sp.]
MSNQVFSRQMRFRFGHILFLSILTWWQPAVAADTLDVDLEKLYSLSLEDLINMPIVTASRQNETRDQTPAHIMLITREQIRERRYKNLADLLEDMPGVDLMRGTKSSSYNNFTVQGNAGSNMLMIMLDGVRVGHPVGGTFPVAENFSLFAAKQVEILFGPAAALYGADAVAGVVNIITDHAGRQKGAWASVGTGSSGSREASFMAGLKTDGEFSLDVGGHWQRSDRAALQNYYPAEFAKTDARNFAGTVVVPVAMREDYVGGIGSHSLFARMDMGKDLTVGFYRNGFSSLTSTGDKPSTALYLSDSHWISKTDTVYGKYRFDLKPNLSGELVIDYSNRDVDPQAKYVNIYTAFVDSYSYVLGNRLGIEQNLNWKLNDMHRAQMGIGYQKYYAIETSSLPGPYDTGKGPGEQGFYYPNTSIPLPIYDASFNNISAYAQLQSEWSSQFSTMAGLRLDRRSDYGKSINPRLGMVWRASKQHLFKALYGEAFRAPSPEESLTSFGSFDGSKDANGLYRGTGFRAPNFNLKPEKAKTLSLTWDWRPREDLNVVANAYHSQIQNLIVTLPSTAVNAIPGAILINPEIKGNAGTQTQTGLDLMAQWNFQINPTWAAKLWSSASWIEGKSNEGDSVEWDLRYVASHKYKLGTTLSYFDRVSITPKILWIGGTTNGRKKNSRNPPERLVTPGYTLTNLHIGWHKLLDGKGTLWLDVYNLFDKRYYAAAGSGSLTFFDMPQQPRSGMVAFEYNF